MPRGRNEWWDGAVVYEIYPRSFQDTDGDGTGDLPGIIDRLDYLNDGSNSSLGVDAIWLTPIYPSPLFDFGYDVADYTAIDPLFGTMSDFERLTDSVHQRGMKVIMDLVANHTSHLHPWFQESREDRENRRRDWYIWRDPKPGGGPPNNWRSVFGGSAWTLDEETGQYYLHSFLSQQPDLNWYNPEVRQAIFDVVDFWIDRGVDGFRLDAVNHIAKDRDLRDNPVSTGPLDRRSTGYDSVGHVYDKSLPILHDWLADLRQSVDRKGKSILLISEIYGLTPEMVRGLHGGHARPQVHVSFNFDLLEARWDASSYRQAVETFLANLPEGATPNVVLNNHDNMRIASRFDEAGLGEARARVAALLVTTLPGISFLYYGEELGMRDGVLERDQLRDPVGRRFWPHNPGRDGARTPMQWDAGPHAGFTTGEPWLPINPDSGRVNVAAEERDKNSMLSLYRRLIQARHSCAALRLGRYVGLEDLPDDLYGYEREREGERVVVLLNFADAPRTAGLISLGVGSVLAATHEDRIGRIRLDGLELRANEGLVVALE